MHLRTSSSSCSFCEVVRIASSIAIDHVSPCWRVMPAKLMNTVGEVCGRRFTADRSMWGAPSIAAMAAAIASSATMGLYVVAISR